MKKLWILSAVLSGILFSCHKKEKAGPAKPQQGDTRQYSYWTVNEDSFKTNDVDEVLGLGMCVLGNAQNDHENNFTIAFNIGHSLPTFGYFQLAKVQTQDPNIVGIGFYYHTLWLYLLFLLTPFFRLLLLVIRLNISYLRLGL